MSLIQLFCDECHKSNLGNYNNNEEDYSDDFYTCSCGLVECDDCYERGDTYFQNCAGCHERLCEGCLDYIFEDDDDDSLYCFECLKEYIPRRDKLENKLNENSLVLRQDSKLCKKFIKTGEPSLEYIIQRMGEMKFLFEYCDMREELEITEEMGYFYNRIFDITENRVLGRINGYPKIFPWETDRSARIIQKHCHNWLWKPV